MRQEIDWNVQGIPSSDPHTQETELQVQNIIDLQHIANKLPNAFTDYKGVTKSYYPARNVPKRIEVPNKTIQLPPQKLVQGKRGGSKAINQDVAPKRQRKQNSKNSELVNVTQQQVERHQVNKQNSHPTSTMHSISDVGTSERPDDIILGNNEPSQGVQEISINYIDSGESYDRKTTIVDIYFAETIAEIIQNNPDPKTMAECKKRSDWNKWKEAIQAELASLTKKKGILISNAYTFKNLPCGV